MPDFGKTAISSKHFKSFCYNQGMKTLLGILTVIILAGFVVPSQAQLYYDQGSTSTPSNAQQYQTQMTDKGAIKVGFYTDPQTPDTSSQTKMSISFLNKDTDNTQQHIDYKVFIKKGQDQIFGIPVTHTAAGSVTVPFQFHDAGTYQIIVEVDGILFQAIPPETAIFSVTVGAASVPEFPAMPSLILVIGILSTIYFTKGRITR